MRIILSVLSISMAAFLCACGNPGTATVLSTSCAFGLNPDGIHYDMNVILSLPATADSAPGVRVTGLTIVADGLTASGGKTVTETEKVNADVPGTSAAGWGNGVTLRFPAPDGPFSNCRVQSWK